jgi:hypothetical protein
MGASMLMQLLHSTMATNAGVHSYFGCLLTGSCCCCCLQVFPQLYLPVMEESNARVLRPHRKYLPTPRCEGHFMCAYTAKAAAQCPRHQSATLLVDLRVSYPQVMTIEVASGAEAGVCISVCAAATLKTLWPRSVNPSLTNVFVAPPIPHACATRSRF